MFNNLFKQGLKKSRDTWFSKVMGVFDRASIDDSVWGELEELLVCADVGVATTQKLITNVKERVKTEKVTDSFGVRSILKEEMVKILTCQPKPITNGVSPKVVMVVGVNGGGKTTSVGKLAHLIKSEGKSVMLVAADTFRAAAIDQLRRWGEVVRAEVVAHQPGADPGAVVFDALEAARNRNIDEVLVDTAGRLHTKYNLMEELKKIRRVAAKLDPTAPHEVILVLDATTGQNGLAQAKYFAEAVGVTGILLAKLDGTAKGGIVLAICDELNIPVQYVGVGEKAADLAAFDARAFVEALTS